MAKGWPLFPFVVILAPTWNCEVKYAELGHLLGSGWSLCCAHCGKSVSRWSSPYPLCPTLGAYKHLHTPHRLRTGFPFVSSDGPQNSQEGLYSMLHPRTRLPNLWLELVTPRLDLCPCNLPFPLSLLMGYRFHLIIFFSFSLATLSHGDLSYCLGCTGVFLLVFSKVFSTCWCIFDVFMGGGEYHILLIHHLDQTSSL